MIRDTAVVETGLSLWALCSYMKLLAWLLGQSLLVLECELSCLHKAKSRDEWFYKVVRYESSFSRDDEGGESEALI